MSADDAVRAEDAGTGAAPAAGEPDEAAPPAPFVKRFLPRSLFGRSLLIIVTPLILLQVVAALIFFETHWDKITRRLSYSVAGDVAAVMDMMRREPPAESREWAFNVAAATMSFSPTFREGEVLERTGTIVEGEMEETLLKALRQLTSRPVLVDSMTLDDHVIISVQLQDGVLEIITDRKRLFSTTTYVFVLWMVGTSLILLAIAMVFMRNQVKPIRRLAVAADNFGKGREVTRFKPEGAREVRQAAQAFLAMRERIQRQISQRTDMLAGVSHDLRTPLTRMKLQLALLKGEPGVEELESDVAEMEHMLEGYLAFARGEGTEKPRPTELGALLGDAVDQARRHGGVIDLHVEDDIEMPLRPDAFRRCVTNLVENAARYGEHVFVRAGRRGDTVEITIDDDGPGIPPESREDVFRPFFRLESSRNPGTGGVGLGLTIARDVIRGHGGDLILGDSPTGGLRALVRLPL